MGLRAGLGGKAGAWLGLLKLGPTVLTESFVWKPDFESGPGWWGLVGLGAKVGRGWTGGRCGSWVG